MPYERYGTKGADPSPLGQPITFSPSGRTALNRFMKSPMAEGLATWDPKVPHLRGEPTKDLIELYRRWGEGGWGMIVTGNIDTSFDSLDDIGDMIITPKCEFRGPRFEKFQELAKGAKAHGSFILGQISHPGRQVQYRLNKEAISASDVQLEPKMDMMFGKPHAASKAEIDEIVEGFAYAAEYLEKAGFDGVELHGAHGYLIAQFLSRRTNKRTDEYGTQTTENRLRFITDIARAIRKRVSPHFIVASKLNSVEFQDAGVTAEEAQEVCICLEREGFDFVELSGGNYESFGLKWGKESTKKREGFFLKFAEIISEGLSEDSKLKLYLVGGLRTTAAMLEVLNIVDGVSFARPAAAEPDFPLKVLKEGVTGSIKPVDGYDSIGGNFAVDLGIAKAQLTQTARGYEPIDLSDGEVVKRFQQDIDNWWKNVVADGDKLEYIRAPEYSGPLKLHE
ncbi:FMN-linked oxidoreductase [Trichoderma sp. SZMC 28012]